MLLREATKTRVYEVVLVLVASTIAAEISTTIIFVAEGILTVAPAEASTPTSPVETWDSTTTTTTWVVDLIHPWVVALTVATTTVVV
jgi:hypothetical protein